MTNECEPNGKLRPMAKIRLPNRNEDILLEFRNGTIIRICNRPETAAIWMELPIECETEISRAPGEDMQPAKLLIIHCARAWYGKRSEPSDKLNTMDAVTGRWQTTLPNQSAQVDESQAPQPSSPPPSIMLSAEDGWFVDALYDRIENLRTDAANLASTNNYAAAALASSQAATLEDLYFRCRQWQVENRVPPAR